MILTFNGLTWDEVKDNIQYMDERLQKHIDEIDVLYDVTFIKNDIVFTFVFQHDELESVDVYKKGEL